MRRYPIIASLLAALLAVAIASCGGDDSATTTSATVENGDAEISSTQAKEIFIDTCGSCHTLKDADTTGSIGPNLDELEPDTVRVETQIKQGGDQMPANLLHGQEAKAVAKYVSSMAGK